MANITSFKKQALLAFCFLIAFNAYSQDQTVNGNLHIKPNHEAMGYNSGLYFTGNTDDIWIRRYNAAHNQTEFRLNISDDTQGDDMFVIGSTYHFDSLWYPHLAVLNNGNIGIGISTPTSKLTVAGKIAAQEVKVSVNAGADFVFHNDYQLKSLAELESFIKKNNHLPDIASAKEMESEGMNLSEMNIKLLKKIEELTLYVIKQQKDIEELRIELRSKK